MASPPSWFEPGSEFDRWPELIFRSLRLSSLTAISAPALGIAIAFALVRCRWTLAVPTRFLWSLGLFLPLPIVATVWLGAISNLGRSQVFGISSRPLITGWSAAWFVHTIATLPLVVTILAMTLERTDADLEADARLRHPRRLAIVHSTLRSIRPTIFATILIVLIVTTGDMTVTDLVQERTFAEETYLQAQMGDGLTAAARTALPITAILSLAILAWIRFDSRKFGETIRPGLRKSEVAPWFMGKEGKIAGMTVLAVTVLVGILPLFSLVWRAGRSGGVASIERFPSWSIGALARNLVDAAPDLSDTSLWTLSISLIVAIAGTVIAWCMVRTMADSKPGRIALALGASLGLAVPGPVAGLAVLWLWMPVPVIYDSPFVIVMAILFRFLGIAVFLLWAAFCSIQEEIEEYACLNGLNGYERFRRIEWPIMAPTACVSALAMFALALGELPATNMTVPPGVEMMSVRLWSLMHTGMESHLAAFVLLMTIVLSGFFGATLLLASVVLRGRRRASTMIE
ncbi:hypothetical protein GC170_06725 [bacterium]|nr:hypothetical protein [bacterium]